MKWLTRTETPPAQQPLMAEAEVETMEQEVQVDEWMEKQQILVYEMHQELERRQEQVDQKQELINHLENLVNVLRNQIQLNQGSRQRDERISLMPNGHVYHYNRKCEWFAKGKWYNACHLCKNKAEDKCCKGFSTVVT